MSFVDKIVSVKEKLMGKQLGLFNGSETNAEKLGVVTEWFFSAPLGMPRGIDLSELRAFAKSNYVRTCTDTIIKEVDQTPWAIVPRDDEDTRDLDGFITLGTEFLNNPNRNKDTFSELVKPMLKDVLEIDAGVWIKVFDGSGNLVELWARDGGSFLKKIDYRGVEELYYQYSWRNPLTKPIAFETNEVVYFMNNPSSYHIYGFSPLQSIQQVVDLLINATRFNKDFFQNNAIPDGIFSLVNANIDTLNKFQSKWNQNMKGKAHKLGFINSEIDFKKFNVSNREMEWLEGQKFYLNLVCSIFGVSMADITFTDTTGSKSVQAGQERVTVKSAIKPYLSLIEKHINLEILPVLLKVSPEDCPIKFQYQPDDHAANVERQTKMIDEYKNGLITKNEYRVEMGYDMVDEGDDFKSEPTRFNMFGQPERQADKETIKEELDEKRKSLVVKGFVEDTNEVIDESKDYNEWLTNKFGLWERRVLRAVETTDIAKKDAVYVKKTFGDFLASMFNSINTTTFFNSVKHFIKQPMKEGLEEAEKEMRIDVGVTESFENQAKYFATQQLEGYTLPDGKKWHGIKGATRELQTKILGEVRDGVINKESQSQIKGRVQKVFKTAKEGQATRIARTETNRFVNSGKNIAYIESGLDGKKEWVAHVDDKTSPLCKRLNGQKVRGTDVFIDSKTGKQFLHPPSHPNCRSTLQFVLEEE